MKAWKAVQWVQLGIFLGVCLWVLLRPSDGHGAREPLWVKALSLGLWAAFYGIVLAIEGGLRRIRRKRR